MLNTRLLDRRERASLLDSQHAPHKAAEVAADADKNGDSGCGALQARALATLLGLGFILPWAAANNALPYYGDVLSSPRLPFILNLAYCAPFLPVPIFLLALAASAPKIAQVFYRVAIPVGFLALAACMALLPLLPGRGVGGVWLFALLAGVAPGVLSNVIQTSVFALNAALSPHLNPYVWAGQGCAGVLAAALQVAAKAGLGSAPAAEARASQLYFAVTAAFAVACAIAWEVYARHPYVAAQRAARAAEAAAQADALWRGRPHYGVLTPAPDEDALVDGSGKDGEDGEVRGRGSDDEANEASSDAGAGSRAPARSTRLASSAASVGTFDGIVAGAKLPRIAAGAGASSGSALQSRAERERYATALAAEATLGGLLPRLWDLWAVLVLNFAMTFLVMPLTFAIPYVGRVARIDAFAPPADATHAWLSIVLFACYNVGDTCAYFSRTAGVAIPGCGARRPQLLVAALLRAGLVVAGFLLLRRAAFGAANDLLAVAFCLAFGFSSGYIESSAMFYSENGRGIATEEGRALVGNVGGNCVVLGLFLGGVCSYAWTGLGPA